MHSWGFELESLSPWLIVKKIETTLTEFFREEIGRAEYAEESAMKILSDGVILRGWWITFTESRVYAIKNVRRLSRHKQFP